MFKEEDFEKLAWLCRIDCKGEERDTLLRNLPRVLDYISQLNEVDTTGVSSCNHVLESHVNIFREDEPGEQLERELFLANSPQHVGGMIKIPPVMKEE